MYNAFLHALRIAAPAAAGPAGILIPTLMFVVACRKVTLSIH